MEWMIYGANGYTGQLIIEEALKRGWRPILAGRSRANIEPLAQKYGLPARIFSLEKPAAVQMGLRGVELVLHCAGPFSKTCAPMVNACLEVGAHYLDITGEIDVFEYCHQLDAAARQKGIVVMPGAGFDVVPTDCLASILKLELPNATHLVLAFDAPGGPSPGTAKTAIEGLGKGGRARIDGAMSKVPLAWKTRSFDKNGEQRLAMTIPWGDVYTAFVSTGIPNIEVYMCVPPSTVEQLRKLRRLGPLLNLSLIQKFLKAQAAKKVRGPSEAKRKDSETWIWGEVTDNTGRQVSSILKTPNGYTLTALAALGVVNKLMAAQRPIGGFFTPSRLMGADYVLRLPGVKRLSATK
ncbi:MAG: saccharopine dehydrogenase NADP-binding domain-containing protein [Arenimonas sp.]|nr:saccharopine dehydrogenase NADP-binding domain-containing protein [Arenimonas sp.]